MKLDPNTQHIEIDLGGRRFTHYPSGDTLLRHDYMRWQHSSFPQWKEKIVAFVARHPDTHLMTLPDRTIIDDIRTWPTAGGCYKIGDFVVSRGTGDRPDIAREIIASVDTTGKFDPTILDHNEMFVLEDGELMWWDGYDDRWSCRDPLGETRLRVRPLLPNERSLDFTYQSGDMVCRLAQDYEIAIEKALASWGLGQLVTDLRPREKIEAELQVMKDRLSGELNAFRGTGPLTDLVDAVRVIVTWAEEAKLYDQSKGTDLSAHSDRIAGVTRRAAVVLSTLQRRGLDEVVALAP